MSARRLCDSYGLIADRTSRRCVQRTLWRAGLSVVNIASLHTINNLMMVITTDCYKIYESSDKNNDFSLCWLRAVSVLLMVVKVKDKIWTLLNTKRSMKWYVGEEMDFLWFFTLTLDLYRWSNSRTTVSTYANTTPSILTGQKLKWGKVPVGTLPNEVC